MALGTHLNFLATLGAHCTEEKWRLTENKTSKLVEPFCVCGFPLGLLNANEHPEETVSGGGAHCMHSGSILLQVHLLAHSYPEDLWEKQSGRGGNINSRVARGSY